MERRRGTVRDLRRDNRSVLLWSLYFNQPLSRQDLSQATGLSPASVSNVTRELISEGVVIEAGSVDSDGGRPRVLLRMNPDHGYVIGVDVGETRIRVELFDLMMTVRAKADYPLNPHEHGVEQVVDGILAGLATVLADGEVDASSVLGVGIGVPGVVEQGAEVLVHGQTYGWDAVPLERLLRAGTDLPLYIDNGAKTMGQAELWFGAGRGAQNAVIGLIGSGVGASIITNGSTHRGATSSAGEWGHTTVMVGGRTCRCGSSGCLEAYVGAEAVLDRYGLPLPGDDQETALATLIDAGTAPDASTTALQAVQVLDDTVRYLGAGIAGLINLFNP
jgi:predicted NBD/HSP70 family sugar kinase